MAYLLYKHLRGKGSRPREPCEHERSMGQNSDSPLELSHLAPSWRGDDCDIDGTSSPQRIAQKSHIQTTHEHANFDPTIPCSICKQEKQAANRYRWKLIAGLCLPFSVQALDATIIAGALPFIASDFSKYPVIKPALQPPRVFPRPSEHTNTPADQLSQLNWIVSAFNLTSATFIPAWGQFADVFGRYTAIQTASVTMLVGSALCAGAPVTAFPMLLVGRALQGIGCAGLLIVTKVILADKVSLKENAKNNTVFTLFGGVGYGVGPVIGGYLTQANWRWCFILNIPIGVVGVVLVHFVLRPELFGPQKITRSDGATVLK